MRSYPTNSPQAAGRILALTMVIDGNLAQSELAALDRSRILAHVDLSQDQFQQLIEELCNDMLGTAAHGVVQLDTALIDALLREIERPALRRHLLQAMWSIADADGWLADGEAVLLSRAGQIWGAETGFATRAAAL